ncbi:class I SAM-dependent methyltransferase [Halalkalibaculum sp. DA3122]|uniref:class I SAM-dependent methyltransferase n=1 Tax=Halalkalibaculum sp. DA3122 TaxID=3373607 RepID=UPI0037544C53
MQNSKQPDTIHSPAKPDTCILCHGSNVRLFYQDVTEQYRSDYYQCDTCRLIFAPERHRPTPQEELERYDQHNNDPEDERYRAFLGRLFNPLIRLLGKNSKGLDFGSGPGPTLNIMFEEQGHTMRIYDPFYADDPSVFGETYDFITSTEVAEHLHTPRHEFDRLWNCLRPGGYLGIMTKLAEDDNEHFADWHYRLDNTHVTFYTKQTFRWLARQWNATLDFYENNVMIFQKSS